MKTEDAIPMDAFKFNWKLPKRVQAPTAVDLIYGFKSWTRTPASDAAAMDLLVKRFQPDVLVLSLTLWGCRGYEMYAMRSDIERSRFTKPLDKGDKHDDQHMSCSQQVQSIIDMVNAVVAPGTVIVHIVEDSAIWDAHAKQAKFVRMAVSNAASAASSRLGKSSQPHSIPAQDSAVNASSKEWIERTKCGVEGPVEDVRHVFLEKERILEVLPDEVKSKHGHEGVATDAFADAIFTVCDTLDEDDAAT